MLEGLRRSSVPLIAIALLAAGVAAAPAAEIAQWRNHLLTSNDAEIRNIAALALLSVDDPAALQVLVETLRDPDRTPARLSILRALAIKGDARLIPQVIRLLVDPVEKIPAAAADALAAQREPAAIRAILTALQNPEQPVRLRAQIASVLAQMRELKAVEPLIDLLAADEEALRRAALQALQKLTLCSFGYDQEPWRTWWAARKDQPREALLEDIIQRQNEQIEVLNRTVGQLWRRVLDTRADPKDPAPVYDALASPFPAVQVYALSLLADLKPDGWEERVIPLRNAPNQEVRAALAEALGNAKDKKAVKALEAMLEDADRGVVAKAARALGRLKAREALPALARLFGAESGPTAIAAVEAIGEIGSPAAAPILGSVLADSKAARPVREEAALALGKITAPESLACLVKVLNDPEERIRWSATDALGRLGLKEAIEPIGKVLKSDKNANVRQVAALSLERIGGTGAVPHLLAAMDDPEKNVADQAVSALANVTGPDMAKQIAFIADLAKAKANDKVVRMAKRVIETTEPGNGHSEGLRDVRRLLADALVTLGNWEEAAQVFARLVNEKPDVEAYEFGLIQCYARLGDRDKLLAAAAVALEHFPGKAGDWFPLVKPAVEALIKAGDHAALVGFVGKLPAKALAALPKEERAWLSAREAESAAKLKQERENEQAAQIQRLVGELAVVDRQAKAAEALKAIGKPAVPALIELVKTSNGHDHQDTAIALLEAITGQAFNIKPDTPADQRAELIKTWTDAHNTTVTPKPAPANGGNDK